MLQIEIVVALYKGNHPVGNLPQSSEWMHTIISHLFRHHDTLEVPLIDAHCAIHIAAWYLAFSRGIKTSINEADK
jgi:hypothetical protein